MKAVAEANTARRSRNQMLVVVLRVNLPATALNYFTAKRLEINSPGLQAAFRPGNQRPRKCDLKGRHTYVAPNRIIQEAVKETDSVAPTRQFSFLL